MLCPKCGFDNQAGVFCCVKCGAKIPRFMQEAEPGVQHTPISGRLQVIENAVSNVLGGVWELERFLEFLQELRDVLSAKEQEIRDIAIPEENRDEFNDELTMGFSGISLYNRGIAQMLTYNGSNSEVLESGLNLVRQGNERINEAMRINRSNRNKLEEEIARDSSDML